MAQEHIDSLLERYLLLLEEYTKLREQLSRCQSDAFHSLARANFSAERSMRFGRDHYDERMQASRKLEIIEKEDGEGVNFETVNTAKAETKEEDDGAGDEEQDMNIDDEKQDEADKEETKAHKEKKPVDPLFWFGLFPSTHLRNVQAHSTKAVEDIIPRLVTINTEMQNIEIEVRRARKKRAKAADKQSKVDTHNVSPTVEAS